MKRSLGGMGIPTKFCVTGHCEEVLKNKCFLVLTRQSQIYDSSS